MRGNMKKSSKKTGVATNGHIENVNSVQSIKCNCKRCFHAKKAVGTIYCKYYDTFSPNKSKCARFSPNVEYGAKRKQEFTMSTYKPTFPWETI